MQGASGKGTKSIECSRCNGGVSFGKYFYEYIDCSCAVCAVAGCACMLALVAPTVV